MLTNIRVFKNTMNTKFGELPVSKGAKALVITIGSFIRGVFHTEDNKCSLYSDHIHCAAVVDSTVRCKSTNATGARYLLVAELDERQDIYNDAPDAVDADFADANPACVNAAGDATEAGETLDLRNMVEACCGRKSRLGRKNKAAKDCLVHRITQQEDFRKKETVELCKSLIKGPRDSLWGSIPCTGGSPFQIINALKGPATAKKIKGH